ncbi:MAG TPA: helix-hairpin-helix domain-containing protein [Longilinea sp.]|nr:helix-hairpin-helix domain-containing protein [Longilinea sp.]
MDKQELAAIFVRIADLLEIKGEIPFKTVAYRNAAESLRITSEDIHLLLREGRLKEIPGVGDAIAKKIEELLTTGKLGFLERLENEVPPSLLELLQVPGLGPKKAALFWRQANITTLAQLEAAAKAGKLHSLPGMGEKSEERLLEGIRAIKAK